MSARHEVLTTTAAHDDLGEEVDDHGGDRTHQHHDPADDVARVVTLVLIGTVAVIVARLTLGGGYTSLVRTGMKWPLVASAAVLAALVISHLFLAPAQPGHHHLRPGLYLLVPVALSLAVAPAPLSSFAAERSNVIPSPTSPFAALDTTGGPAELSVLEFGQRALDRDGETLRGVTVRLTGFVMSGRQLRLARFRLACCAADAQAAIVSLKGVDTRPAADDWITVEGRFDGWSGDVPVLAVDLLQPIQQPADPYEPA